jgi:ATPase subunit of ABC transporter with duplicated ATPase domains
MENSENDYTTQEWEDICKKINEMEIEKDEALVKTILHGLGFSHEQFSNTYYMFSGGWRTRISLARALYMKPRILFLDEPTNHLDMEAIFWLQNYLLTFSGILIFVSHNIRFLHNLSTYIIHIHQSNLKTFKGNYYRFRKQLEEDLKKQTKDWDKLQKEYKNLRSKGKSKEAAELEKKKIAEGLIRPEKPYKIVMDFSGSDRVKSPYIQIQNVSFQYKEGLPWLLENIQMNIEEKTRISIVGKNGCGKSTFIKLLKGDIQPKKGNILRNENVVVSYFNQHSVEQLPEEQSPLEYLKNQYPELSDQELRQYLGKISLESTHHIKPIKILSGGQKMRIVFSEICIKKPHILLLDEPTNHLDIETIECLIDSLSRYEGSVIIISHDVALIEDTECKVYHLEKGSLKLLKRGMDEYLDTLYLS